MDGNGRWARNRGLPRTAGHHEGALRVRDVAEACIDVGVSILTVFAFSTENWDRPHDEVNVLMALVPERLEAERATIFENEVRVRVLGEIDTLPLVDRVAVQAITRQTMSHQALTLNIAFNYGGRSEILRGIRNLIRDGVQPDDVSEDLFASYLYTAELPDPDLVIRTAGEQRLSNFLVWQAAYAEFFSTPTLWPDFTREAFNEALASYGQRDRKFGRVVDSAPITSDLLPG